MVLKGFGLVWMVSNGSRSFSMDLGWFQMVGDKLEENFNGSRLRTPVQFVWFELQF